MKQKKQKKNEVMTPDYREQIIEKLAYKEKIIELVEKIENPATLASIYSFIRGVLRAKEKQGTD